MKNLSLTDYVEIAIAAHKGQFRRDGKTPYITHVRRAADSWLLKGNDFARSIAWLHDILEDTLLTKEDLYRQGVTHEALNILDFLTHSPEDTYVDYINRLCIDSTARLVKIADTLDNLTDNPTPQQVEKYLKALKILTQEHL